MGTHVPKRMTHKINDHILQNLDTLLKSNGLDSKYQIGKKKKKIKTPFQEARRGSIDASNWRLQVQKSYSENRSMLMEMW